MRTLMLLTCAAIFVSAANASSVITYQGLLQQGGSPFTGTVDEMLFELYDAESGGTAVAGPIPVTNVIVSQGLFQAELDFGVAAFESPERWLQITINGVALEPRQRISAVPFAIRALTVTEVPGTLCDLDGFGELCSAGVGACERAGFMVCDSEGTALECNAVAGEPSPELCNGIDDNCSGEADDGFPELGQSCVVGVGTCERAGVRVCSADQLGTQCNAIAGSPSPEICDGLDNSCDGTIDVPWLNSGTGLYDHDEACGSCGVDCTLLLDLPNAAGSCSTSGGQPACVMNCETDTFNLNGSLADGCEFVLDANAIYVSIQDPAATDGSDCGLGPVGTGAGHFPCLSVTTGLARAVALGRMKVLVAHGHYVERVQLSNGVSLFGGYQFDTWERVGGGTTLLDAAGPGHRKTLVASGITTPTTVEGFFIQGRTPTTAGSNSYAVWIANSTSALTVENNQITSGNGASGVDGAVGTDGMPGVAGLGRDSDPGAYDALVATNTGNCNVSNNRQHANGGVRSCGAVNVSGGPGGGNQCPPSPDFSISSGISGFVGLPAGGAGGDPGYDAVLANAGTLCQSPNPLAAANGSTGASGNPGGSGTGCSAGSGTVFAGEWTGSFGGIGAVGGPGTGGGGGGGGGGAHCESCPEIKDRLGGHGGGGGSGGCGGLGGIGAGAGGASIGIFIVSSGASPTLVGNTIVRGQGGAGGRGGNGGVGGSGGVGGVGGESIFCTGTAGSGGRGGDGAAGGGGGGGCGGPSFGIYVWGIVSPPNYCIFNMVSGGAGGAAGSGGLSLGNSGTAGVPGPMSGCHTG